MNQDVKPHIKCARSYWKSCLIPGDRVIDATVGNGHDTVFLASLLNGKGEIIGYDIQPQAIESAKKRLGALPKDEQGIVFFKLRSHALFEERNVKLIVYNLGYLPGSDKGITTLRSSTIESLKKGIGILQPQGAISITCYPGHEEGKWEEQEVLNFVRSLPSNNWSYCYHQWLRPNQMEFSSPSLIWLQALPCA